LNLVEEIVVLSPRVPELAALEVLLVLARTGSLNSAAVEVGVSQQAVSARIASLEAQTGVVLVTRTPRGSSLTPAGVVVAEWAARLLDVANQLDAGLAALRGDRASKLRVSSSLTVAEHLLPGWLVALRVAATRHGRPPVEVDLRATNSETTLAEVRAGSAELGFVEGPSAPRGLRSRAVGSDRLVIVVRPDHAWARRRQPLGVEELAVTALVTRESGSGTRQALEAALRSALGSGFVPLPPALALSTSAAVRAAVIAGAGPAVLSELAVADDLAAGRLRLVAVAGLELERTLRAVWMGSATPPAGAARDLIAIATGVATRQTGGR
jgi:DNA-binding transcriptional LysR family regulator